MKTCTYLVPLRKLLVCCGLLLGITVPALAGKEHYFSELKGRQVAPGGAFTVTDEKFGDPAAWNLIDRNISVDNILSFGINFDTSVYFYSRPFHCTINVTIHTYANPDDTSQESGTPQTVDLEIGYDTTAGVPYKGIAMYKFRGAYKYRVVINSISSEQYGESLPAIFRLKGETIIERKYVFNDRSTDVSTYSLTPSALTVNWVAAAYPGAELFDLEWTVADDSSAMAASIRDRFGGSGLISIPSDTLDEWFRNNSTRVTTAATSYTINLPYDGGYLLYRIRGVQLSYPDGIRLEGFWNYQAAQSGGTGSAAVKIDWHEEDLNWQYTAAFAEEGKKKEVVSYFDGTLRGRQSVTLNNSDQTAVVQENIYDELGRPSIQVLPAPVDDATLHFFPGFNINTGGAPYSFADFPLSCDLTAAAMGGASGAARYYSAGNPFTEYAFTKYIPDAEGYPFAVTQYMPDNTGRIKSRAGVGPGFQPGSGHETTYFYGKPTQTELDRLFGSEAGKASHYLKNMVVDPNGQISVSYVNAGGKTVATALAGKVPDNLASLPSNNDSTSVNVSNDLVLPEDFAKDYGDYSLSATATFLAPVTGDYKFAYEVDPLRLEVLHGADNQFTICSDCYYDVDVTVTDDCNNPLYTAAHPAGFVFDTACAATPPAIADSFTLSIGKIGEYYVHYALRISRPALDFYDSVNLVKNTNIRSFDSFLQDELNKTDFSGCFSDCQTCLDNLGEKDDFTARFRSLFATDSVPFTTGDSLFVAHLYDSLLTNCAAMAATCMPAQTVCDEKLDLLKADVTPGGQYALYDSAYNILEPDISVLSKYQTVISYPDENGLPDYVVNSEGVSVPVNQLTPEEFIRNWKDSWADSLVKFHPEYCYYLWCTVASESYAFDRALEEVYTDADTAKSVGYFNHADYAALLKKDPFFAAAGLGHAYYDAMDEGLRLFSRSYVGLGQLDRNILQFIDIILYCRNQSNGWEACIAPDSACRAEDREWLLYKELYLNLKRRYYELARRASEDPVLANCTNCYVGSGLTFNLPAGTDTAYVPYDPGICINNCSGGVYTPVDKPGLSFYIRYGSPGDPPTGSVPAGYTDGQFYNVFVVHSSADASCEFANAWVYIYDSAAVSEGDPGDFICQAGSFDFEDRGEYSCPPYTNTNHQIHITRTNGPEPEGQTDTVRLTYHYNDPDNLNGGDYYHDVIFYPGDDSVNFCMGINIYEYGAGYITVASVGCGPYATVPAQPDIVFPPENCPDDPKADQYRDKQRRFLEYVNTEDFMQTALAKNPQQGAAAQEQAMDSVNRSTCEAQADTWIQILSGCTTDSAKLAQLKQALIDICAAGSGLDRPYGSSSVPDTSGLPYHSFEEAIAGILGPAALSASCTEELLANPYPYEHPVKIDHRIIVETNYDICNRIMQFKSAYAVSGFTGSFHQYLQQELGGDYTITEDELNGLLSSCTTCNFILKNNISLPLAFEPDAHPCLSGDSAQTLLDAFRTKFPGIDSTSPDYERLLVNFFNHRLGFSLSYYDYQDFLESCAAHPGYTALLCNQPATVKDTINENSCIEEMLNAAMTNAQNLYVVYIDSVRRDFREAFLNKCMNVQPRLSMTADLYEYHYTLYYYDQSGNLVKTIPPAGVHLLSQEDVAEVELDRLYGREDCYQYTDELGFTGGGYTYFEGEPYLDPASQTFTVESWLYFENTNDQGILSYEAPNYDTTLQERGFQLFIRNDSLVFRLSLTDSTYTEAAAGPLKSRVRLNAWNQVAVERFGSPYLPVVIYINGTLAPMKFREKDFPYTSSITPVSGAQMNIGASSVTAGTPYFTGRIKQVRYYHRALFAREVRQNYFDNCFLPTSKRSLALWMPVREGQGNVIDVINKDTAAIAGTTPPNWLSNHQAGLYPHHTMPTTYKYNSLNEVVQQFMPDGDTTRFWYDRLGRLAVSQNAEQKYNPSYDGSANRYSYTRYDALGRITEVGEKSNAADITTINTKDDAALQSWLVTGDDHQVTQTLYDTVNTSLVTNTDITNNQANLRKRVTASLFKEDGSQPGYDNAMHYSYDINGNVKTVWQDIKALEAIDANTGLKRIDYDYDLVSGKVNEVSYQQGKGDQFYYKYTYDADNRLTEAQTSRDGLVWTTDATYQYYLHGPLARMELGQYKVQGVDYAYTLQGWLKGINGQSLDAEKDMGQDGQPNTIYGRVSRDAMAFSLGYYGNDYDPIGANATAFDLSYQPPGTFDSTGNPLYNGNISYTTVTLSKFNNTNPVAYSYGYDQLNRLREMRQHNSLPTTGSWNNTSIINDYKESVNYDGNGNILRYLRNGATQNGNPEAMDNLTYHYQENTNKLTYINDPVASSNYPNDLDNQNTDNYEYDKIGNLVRDNAGGITNNEWTVYGKLKEVDKADGTTLKFTYDATGNRIIKEVTGSTGTNKQYYIRDAQGNPLAIYEYDGSNLRWTEQDLYGSSQLGIWEWNKTIPAQPPVTTESVPTLSDSTLLGITRYELSNHLGNVLSVITDKKIGVPLDDSVVNYYVSEVLSQGDYYAFGMEQPIRKYRIGDNYKYSFNGKKDDREILGWQDYGNREYDRLSGRFISVDPIFRQYPELSPYQFASNSPITGIDIDGMEYLNSNEAKIEFKYGELRVKVANLHNVTKHIITNMMNNPKYWEPEHIGINLAVAEFSLAFPNQISDPRDYIGNGVNYENNYDAPDPSNINNSIPVERPIAKSTNLPDKRYKERMVPTIAPGRTAGVIALTLNLVNYTLQGASTWMTSNDVNTINSQAGHYTPWVIEDLNAAIQLGIIKKEYQNKESLINIANVVLQGVNNTKDKNIYTIGMKIFNEISLNRFPEIGIMESKLDNYPSKRIVIPRIKKKKH